jgi:PAS domain S-box-containing protein
MGHVMGDLLRGAVEAGTVDWFWRLFEMSPMSLQLFTPDGRCVAANAAYERMWNTAAAEIVGSNILHDEQLARSGALPLVRAALSGATVSLPRMFFETGTTDRGGARYVVPHFTSLSAEPTRYIVLALEDVTAAFEAERRAEVQLALTDVLARARHVDEAVHGLLSGLGLVFDAVCAGYWVVTADRTGIECAQTWLAKESAPAVHDFAVRSQGYRLANGQGLPGAVWERAQAIWLAEVLDQRNFPRVPWLKAAGLEGGFAFPLVVDGTVSSVVELFSTRALPRDHDLLRVADSAGQRLGLYLQRRQLEDDLHESEEANRAVVQTALDAIIAMDGRGRIVDFNPAAERMFGFARDAVIGREMADTIIPPDLREAHRAGLARLHATGISHILSRRLELMALRLDGSVFPVELTITRTHRRHEPMFLGFLRDLTERRRHELEREALLARERAARDAAEAASRSKDEFVATVSHELRAPGKACRGWAKLLADKSVPPERVTDAIERLDRAAEVQIRLVEDLLDVSALVTGRMRFTVEEINLRQVIENSCESLAPAAEAKHLKIGIEGPDTVAARGDAVRLQQVFWNLLSNAVKFTPHGGSVTITISELPLEVQISVVDTGPGLDPVLLPVVFEKFRQGSGAAGGLGLGLAIVRHIVEAHAGTVMAGNRTDRPGAIFTVTLPRSTG